MTADFWKEIKEELQKGIHKKGHPFRYCTLATIDHNNTATLRTVVLRRVEDDVKLIFYTDKRSLKISHIKENPKVSFLFYHPKKLLQLKFEGIASIITDDEELKKYWSGIPPNNRKDYTTTSAPGSTIKNPDNVAYLEEENHFCMVQLEPSYIEFLKLKRPNHLRVGFSKNVDSWDSAFLVP